MNWRILLANLIATICFISGYLMIKNVYKKRNPLEEYKRQLNADKHPWAYQTGIKESILFGVVLIIIGIMFLIKI